MKNNKIVNYDYTGIYKPGVVVTFLITWCIITVILSTFIVGIYLLV